MSSKITVKLIESKEECIKLAKAATTSYREAMLIVVESWIKCKHGTIEELAEKLDRSPRTLNQKYVCELRKQKRLPASPFARENPGNTKNRRSRPIAAVENSKPEVEEVKVTVEPTGTVQQQKLAVERPIVFPSHTASVPSAESDFPKGSLSEITETEMRGAVKESYEKVMEFSIAIEKFQKQVERLNSYYLKLRQDNGISVIRGYTRIQDHLNPTESNLGHMREQFYAMLNRLQDCQRQIADVGCAAYYQDDADFMQLRSDFNKAILPGSLGG